jgi:hypothetical protein
MKKHFFILAFLIICGNAFATNYCNDANNVGCWLMEDDGNEPDAGGNTANDLIETSGDIPQSEDKKFGTYSRDFEAGDTEYLYHNDGLETDISGEDAQITICAWVKYETDALSDKMIVSKYDITSNRQYALLLNGTHEPTLYLSSNGTASTVLSKTTSINDSTWHHVCGVSDDVNMYVYLDGSSVSQSFTTGIFNGNRTFSIGARGDDNRYFDGLIDDVGVWNRALSPEEITDIMTNGLLGTSGAPPQIF